MRTLMAVVVLATLSLAGTRRAGKDTLPRHIMVEAGARERRDTAVSFDLPAAAPGQSYELRDDDGRVVALQVDAQGRAWFVLEGLAAGARRRYAIRTREAAVPSAVQAVAEGDSVRVSAGGHPVLRYVGGRGELPQPDIAPSFRRGGYIHPVMTPSGRVVTDDYPADHRHHHGIWFAWTRTEFDQRKPDFWNMGDRTGAVESEALDEAWSGAVQGGIRARHRYVDLGTPAPTTVLREAWTLRVFAVGGGRRPYALFDLDVAHECATSQPLVLPEYHYGGLGVRGAASWKGGPNAFFLTSEGKDRSQGHGTRARWCHVGGRVDGALAGLAILGHPSNFRAPQPMRIHPDDPFFCFAPSQLGRWEITPGTPYVSRYRFVVFDGAPDAAELDRLWEDYADPPRVTVAR